MVETLEEVLSALQIVVRRVRDTVAVVDLQGEIDVDSSPALSARVRELADEGVHQILLNLGSVTYLDSAGLGVVLAAHRRLRLLNGQLSLIAPPPPVQRILKARSLYLVLRIFATEQEALAAIDQHGSEGVASAEDA